jgi:2-keto-3-deoxy-L-rhamnonate aldolase RhmA
VAAKMQSANDEGFLIAQIETARGIDNVDAIAAVEGIDCLWIGHFDLSLSLGIPAQFDHPLFQSSVDRVLEACAKYGKTPGIMGGDVASSKQWLDRGFRAVAYGGDLWIYQEALRSGISELKNR